MTYAIRGVLMGSVGLLVLIGCNPPTPDQRDVANNIMEWSCLVDGVAVPIAALVIEGNAPRAKDDVEVELATLHPAIVSACLQRGGVPSVRDAGQGR